LSISKITPKYNNAAPRVQINPNRWDSRLIGIKFNDVTQWVIAYEINYIPLCRACRGIGENGANVIQLFAELALAFVPLMKEQQ